MYKILASIWLLLMSTTLAAASDHELRKVFNLEQFSGWGSIMLRCRVETGEVQYAVSLCAAVEPEFRYLAESSGIPNATARATENTFQVYSTLASMERPLTLTVSISTIGTDPAAVYIRLWAGKFVSGLSLPEVANGSKSGDFELWSSTVIGAGQSIEDIADQIRPSLIDAVKLFFADFLPAWKARQQQ